MSDLMQLLWKRFRKRRYFVRPSIQMSRPSALKDVFALGTKIRPPQRSKAHSTPGSQISVELGPAGAPPICQLAASLTICSSDTIGKISAAVNTTCGDNARGFVELRDLLCLKDSSIAPSQTRSAQSRPFSRNDTDTDTTANNTTTTADPGDILFTIFLASSTLFTSCNECAKAQYQFAVKLGSTDIGTLDRCGANFTSASSRWVSQANLQTPRARRARADRRTASLLAMSGFFALL
ncbi:hypothetical protein B0H14DRAFT_2614194 [Mycena olivaceomarginata]|nr:hypothetical protein B0H14DRAFT_2634938 [Mycena olivaceomarginata]KAJ7802624.1 hypothetical protein B0H14DRAFT_2614194 [Mycena olivaceomarginata]